MEDALDQAIKNKILRVIEFCEGEGIEDFMFRDMETFNDCYVEFDLENNFDEDWHLVVTFKYLDSRGDSEYIKEDEQFFYKIENENFIQVEDFEEDYEDEFDEEE